MSKNTACEPRPSVRKLMNVPPEEEIVISGIAGRFPKSDNLRELHKNLISKMDLISDDDHRWKLDHLKNLQRAGKINHVEKFDASFFGVDSEQAHSMDPMARMLLEHAYEAIVDAGVNPGRLRGTRTGVFIGASFSESELMWFYENPEVNGFGITGCSRAMMANRISYWLGITGPSYALDTACSSSLSAMEHAYNAIREGHCDAAIVGGSNLCLHPNVTMGFFQLGVLALDGRCKTFDEAANGYVRSETVVVAFLQRARDARRVYATLVHAKTNCDGFKEQGITFPSSLMQSALVDEVYCECGVSPLDLGYMEAHGTGTIVGDLVEAYSIDRILGKGRTRSSPLMIGFVKTNLGHAEPASGMISVSKILLAMESGVLQPSINYKNPRPGIEALAEERFKIVLDPTPWKGGYAATNSFGFGGANCHVLLKSNAKEKINKGMPNDDLPRLVTVSGRTNDAVSVILQDLESKQIDVEYISLLHDIHADNMDGHRYRGYTIVPAHGVTDTPIREIQFGSGAKKPICFVFSGIGCQWPGMGEALLHIPVFFDAIKKCDAVLKPLRIDIFDIITNKDKKTFDNVLYSLVGIAAVMIGLVDILYSIGIKPDNIIGHSFGELGCAYADGCFTAEQMVMSAYSYGLAFVGTKIIKGSTATIGLGYQNLKYICPSYIDVACHDASDSTTISGPSESMKSFVAKLQRKKILAEEFCCNDIPFHSRYITLARSKLLAYLQKVIPDPKLRSSKWLSSSVPIDKWDTLAARFSSADYHTNNLLSTVLFEEISALIPIDAIVIEISPHGILQDVLRRLPNSGVVSIPLMQRGHRDNVEVLLQALGKMFNLGLQPQLSNLYPRVEYPVSRATPMISPLIKWQHSDDWTVASYKSKQKINSGERIVKVALSDSEYQYMVGHAVDGRIIFPATGYLVLIWETLGIMHDKLYTEISVVFENVKFLRATTIPKDKEVEFTLLVQKGTGNFEVVEGDAAVVTGIVRITTNPAVEKIKVKIPVNDEEETLMPREFYKELRLRGYHYSGLFCSITKSTINGLKGHILWRNNWVAFLDNMLQIINLTTDTRGLFVPAGITKITIDAPAHLSQIQLGETNKEFPVYVHKLHNVIVSGGVQIHGITGNAIPRRKYADDPVLEEYKFIPFTDRAEVSLCDIARLSTHITLENHLDIKVRTIEYIEEADKIPFKDLLSPWIFESLGDIPLIQADVSIVSTKYKFDDVTLPSNVLVINPKNLNADASALLVVGHRLLINDRTRILNLLLSELKEGGFILSRERMEDIKNVEQVAQAKGFHIILEKICGKEMFVLLRKQEKLREKVLIIKVNNEKFNWVKKMHKVISEELQQKTCGNTRILLVGQGHFENGLMGLINCLKKELGSEIVRGVLIQDPKAPKFSLQNPLYAEQLQKDLSVCVLRENGVWGSYRYFPLPPLEPKSVHHMWLNQIVRGDLSSLTWLEGPIKLGHKNEDLVNIFYSSINFKDVMLASGKLAPEASTNSRQDLECVIGFEYSGIDASGKRVMGLIKSRGLANLCIADRELTWEVPDTWSLEEAATVPAVYGTCYYGLYLKGRMKEGDKILIHSGTGGVGQAAINLALHEGCEVFITVGTPEKRHFIREHFPQIREDHIGNSRDTSFEQMVMEQTNGRGVDIVLNSLAEEKLQASVSCLAWGGRFLEIGKFDLMANNSLGTECFLREINFQGIMLDHMVNGPNENKTIVKKLLNDGLKNGAIKPLVRTVFSKDQAEAAFRYMAAGKHIGKIILRIRNENESLDTLGLALPRYHCYENRSYIILGGLGGFGLELADWLVLRGAKNLVITSRTGIKNSYQRSRVELWKSYGVNIAIVSGKEASRSKDCKFILKTAIKLASVDGIFNLAVVLKDALWDNQTPESFEESFKCKAWATRNLDVLTRKLCPTLRHFVVFSSISCGRGNAGQMNYGMSNSVMERICERRAAEGLPGLAVQWGAIGDVGLVADMQKDNKELIIGGTLQQRISSCLQVFDGFLQQSHPIVSSMVVAEKTVGGEGVLNIVDTIRNIMGLKDLKGVSLNTSLAKLGMDSMMSIEIKQALEREFEVFLTAKEIRHLDFAKLQEMSTVGEVGKESIGQKSSTDYEDDVETLTGMKLLVRVLGYSNISSETCLRLRTREEAGRSETFLIPGIEGIASVFMTLAPNLNSPAMCLQLGFEDNAHESVFDMADRFWLHLLQKCKDRSNFLLVGYSFGSLIAIELARRFEAQGLNGQLILIDGAPYQLKAIISQQIKSKNETEIENQFLLEIMNIYYATSIDSSKLIGELEKCTKWDDKLQACMKLCFGLKLHLSEESQKNLTTAIYNRIKAVQQYNVSHLARIKTPIILLKPTMPSIRLEIQDYGLSNITSSKVEVKYIPGNHVTMLDNENVAHIINEATVEDP